MSRTKRKDPRQGNAGDLGEWLSKPKNKVKMYRHDREAAAELAAMRETEECATADPSQNWKPTYNPQSPARWNRTPNPKE